MNAAFLLKVALTYQESHIQKMNVREKKPPETPKLIKNRHMIYDNRCRKVQAYITTVAQKRKIGS